VRAAGGSWTDLEAASELGSALEHRPQTDACSYICGQADTIVDDFEDELVRELQVDVAASGSCMAATFVSASVKIR
jgi:hypothetical protein